MAKLVWVLSLYVRTLAIVLFWLVSARNSCDGILGGRAINMGDKAPKETEGKTAAQVIASALIRHGIKTIFSQSLPTALVLAAEDVGLKQFTYRTENAGAAMADGFARVSGEVTVVTAQNGPAASLLVPG